ncbi:MAG: hypothetical protein ACRDN0_06920 [Trebonia sp.]
MAYGHAERTLATIRLLEAETVELLTAQADLAAEEARWLREGGPACPATPPGRGGRTAATSGTRSRILFR